MTPEEYYAERREAWKGMDLETVTIFSRFVQEVDPYGICDDLPPEVDCIGRATFVYSPEVGEIRIYDLPVEMRKRLAERTKDKRVEASIASNVYDDADIEPF